MAKLVRSLSTKYKTLSSNPYPSKSKQTKNKRKRKTE
jgi:hypothetical protein